MYAFCRNNGVNRWDYLGNLGLGGSGVANFNGFEPAGISGNGRTAVRTSFSFAPINTGGIARYNALVSRGESELAHPVGWVNPIQVAEQGVEQLAMGRVDGIDLMAQTNSRVIDAVNSLKKETVKLAPMTFPNDPQWNAAPNSEDAFSAAARGADCAIKTVQQIQKTMGLPVDTPETIAGNLGLPLTNFQDGGEGLKDPTRSTAELLNAALNPSGLEVDHVPVGFDYTTLVAKGNPLILGTEVWFPGDLKGTGHMVPAIPGGNDNSTIKIYNPQGAGGSVTYTPTDAMAHDYPVNASGESGKIWYVHWGE